MNKQAETLKRAITHAKRTSLNQSVTFFIQFGQGFELAYTPG